MTSFLNLNPIKLSSCPTHPEESWRRTDPSLFFLPKEEVLNIQGQSALESTDQFLPWKVCFRDEHKLESRLLLLAAFVGKSACDILFASRNRVIFIEVGHAVVDVYMPSHLASVIEFQSSPWEAEPISQNSPIANALAKRLKISSPHELCLSLNSTKGSKSEKPWVVIANHTEFQWNQSYTALSIKVTNASSCDLTMIEGGSHFSYKRHKIILEKNTELNEFWFAAQQAEQKSCIHLLERLVLIQENAKFYDSQIFAPKGQLRITSNIVLNEKSAFSESLGAVLASEGKFDYEPIQEHRQSNTKSLLKLKMILTKRARASFQGLVLINKIAQKSVALQENKNLLLSSQARIDARPRLEILANDVVCKHGSATAEPDKKQIYYLMSRGFSLQESINIILQSFTLEVLTPISKNENSLSEFAEQAILYALKFIDKFE